MFVSESSVFWSYSWQAQENPLQQKVWCGSDQVHPCSQYCGLQFQQNWWYVVAHHWFIVYRSGGESMNGCWGEPVKDTSSSFHCEVCNYCAAHPELKPSCWIVGRQCSLWTEVVVCTVWGSVILPHTGANCTSDCLAHGGAISSHPLAGNVMISGVWLLLFVTRGCCAVLNPVVVLFFLKILSGTSPFMTTNTSATFLVIAKGESCLYCNEVSVTSPLVSLKPFQRFSEIPSFVIVTV